ncbi:DedA family protein [Xanthobacteraceae bacterium A53D]
MFDLDQYVQPVLTFVRDHQQWAAPIVFALAFGESLAAVSLLIPATVLMLGIGALIEASNLAFFPIWLAASIGAILGDTVSYYIGYYFKDSAKHMWPLSRYPEMVRRGEQFFEKWGVWSVAIGRFFGPARAVVPLIAGIVVMRQIPFQVANIGSAFVWAFVMLAPGAAALKMFGF